MNDQNFAAFKTAALGNLQGTVTPEAFDWYLVAYGTLTEHQRDELCRQAWEHREAERVERAEELAALREDKARLDWLDAQRNFMVRRAWWDQTQGVEVSGFDGSAADDAIYGETVREAIDRARKAAES